MTPATTKCRCRPWTPPRLTHACMHACMHAWGVLYVHACMHATQRSAAQKPPPAAGCPDLSQSPQLPACPHAAACRPLPFCCRRHHLLHPAQAWARPCIEGGPACRLGHGVGTSKWYMPAEPKMSLLPTEFEPSTHPCTSGWFRAGRCFSPLVQHPLSLPRSCLHWLRLGIDQAHVC